MKVPLNGPTYQSQSPNVAAERCINWYVESTEGHASKNNVVLYPTPGLQTFVTLPGGPVRAEFTQNGKCWCISGSTAYELLANGTYTALFPVAASALPAYITSNGDAGGQLLFASGGVAYCRDIAGPTTTAITSITRVSTTATVTTTADHKYHTDDVVAITGAAEVEYNVSATITVTGANTFTYTVTGAQSTAATGTIIASRTYAIALASGADVIGFSDGYFLALDTTTSTLRLSDLEDGTVWPALMVAQRSTAADRWVSMVIAHREVWLFGSQTSEPWYNSGDLFPFTPISGALIEQGTAAMSSPCVVDNTPIWLTQNPNGGRMVVRASGYLPTRISTHAVEFALQGYTTVSDAVGWTYQDQGHSFYVLSFPTEAVTWVYDCATNMWHERGTWDTSACDFVALRHQTHCYAFGKHLVGDRVTGVVSEQRIDFTSDVLGLPLRRVRQTPHLCNEQTWIFYSSAQLDLESGLGVYPAVVPEGEIQQPNYGPQVMLQWSDDGGHTWSNEHWTSAGPRGHYRQRVIWRRLGRSRDRVFRVSVSDPIPWRLNQFYATAEGEAR